MSPVFADTSFFVAFLNPGDEHHDQLVELMTRQRSAVVTTHLVVAELGNFLGVSASRRLFVPFVRQMRRDTRFEIVPITEPLFQKSLGLYARRLDKKWSFTDCCSMIIMQEQELSDVWSNDHHFAQAGFRTLLK